MASPRRTSRALKRSIADSLGIPIEQYAHIAALCRGMSHLGTSAVRISNWLERAGVGKRGQTRVLDLATGKGAAAIRVAQRTGASVVGVDGYEGFIGEARASASASRELRCEFVVDDVVRYVAKAEHAGQSFDVGMMMGLFPFQQATELLRRIVRPGGLMLVDDAIRVRRVRGDRDDPHDDVPTLAEAVRLLEADGDRVLRTQTLPRRVVARELAAAKRRIRAEAARQARELKAAGRRVRREAAARWRGLLAAVEGSEGVLLGPLRPTMWLIRRGR